MARTHARIRLDMWDDDDYRSLSSGAQWLYEFLLSSAGTNFAGVALWRPGQIAGHTIDLNANDVEMYAAELEDGLFVVIDRDTEECLIRSFVKHDGLMGSPNMAKALRNVHASIGSSALRGVVVHELRRLNRARPDLKGWPYVEDLLVRRQISPRRAIETLPHNPSRDPSRNPSGNPSRNPSATPILPSSLPPISPSSSSPSVTRGAANG